MILEHPKPVSISEVLETESVRRSQSSLDEVVIDLTAVDRVSSEELNGLIRFNAKIRQEGRRLVLENVQETLCQIFNVTRLDRLFSIRKTVSS